MDEQIIRVDSLTVGYDDRVVLDDITFSVAKGGIFIILGGSGCGKTTLLKCLIGLNRPWSGDIRIKGKSIVEAEGDEKRSIMRSFGVLYQSGALFGSLTVRDNIALPLEEYTCLPPEMVSCVVEDKLALVGLNGFEDFMPGALSGGMRKRVGLARAMALNPEILFFDEPSAGLDPVSAAQLDRLILNIRESLGTTMVIVTHELDSIFAVGDTAIMLDKNTRGVVANGSPEALRRDPPNEWVREFMGRSGLARNDGTAGEGGKVNGEQ
ncbi:MAG: ATP-binding cassette domain-containing protein [Kiritimatiellaeota bacterium]|nr:ATP-binding cassette domain-containing protein [Kiritimatiellota bacterium]